jgi:hypothetical protein
VTKLSLASVYAVQTLRYSSDDFKEQILAENDIFDVEYPFSLYVTVISGEVEP